MTEEIFNQEEILEKMKQSPWQCFGSHGLYKMFSRPSLKWFYTAFKTLINSTDKNGNPYIVALPFHENDFTLYCLYDSWLKLFEPRVGTREFRKDAFTLKNQTAWIDLHNAIAKHKVILKLDQRNKMLPQRGKFARIIVDALLKIKKYKTDTSDTSIRRHIESFRAVSDEAQTLFGYILAGPYTFDPNAPEFKEAPEPEKTYRIKRTPIILI